MGNESGGEVALCASILKKTETLLVITGAGISAESGLPTYRGPGGLYEKNPEIPHLLSEETLADDPCSMWKYLDNFRAVAQRAKPNIAHRILAQWESRNRFGRFLIATQNIDGLHQAGGNTLVSELHGSAWQMACPRSVDYGEDEGFSGDYLDYARNRNREEILKRWSHENNRTIWEDHTVPFPAIPPYDEADVRPNILLFGEGYGNRLLWVENFIRQKVDTVLVIGCSGGLYILVHLLNSCRENNPNCTVININPHMDTVIVPHLHLSMTATASLSAINAHL
ncbi:MAG: hypothetical protein C4583_03505 [Anaerolineaceae bacterium]|nr:MAG: hypothetical protein C4583_03505 [Anaerolineaceae bacterium]